MAALETALSGPVSQHFHPAPRGFEAGVGPPVSIGKLAPEVGAPPGGTQDLPDLQGPILQGVPILSGPSQNRRPMVWRPWRLPFLGPLASIFTQGPRGFEAGVGPPVTI